MPLDHDAAELERRILKLLGIGSGDLASYSIERKSFDARDRSDIRVVYSVLARLRAEPRRSLPGSAASRVQEPDSYAFPGGARRKREGSRPIIVGSRNIATRRI